MPNLSSSPEYLICLDCEAPCYDFEWEEGKVTIIVCHVCGNDEPDQFITEEDFEAMSGDTR